MSTLTTAPVLEHNDLWGNGTDYEGLAPGASDVHVAPAFVDPQNGDLHLRQDSDLIDAGTNGSMPPGDLDGEPRPQDGDQDGSAVADIGADEYSPPGLYGSKTVDRLTATAGDILTYRVTLYLSGSPYALQEVRVFDAIPSHVTYVPGSLSASSGSWSDAGGIIAWSGTVSIAVPVSLTFKVRLDEVEGPLAIINRAVLDDPGGKPQVLQAVTLIDPSLHYLPVVSKSR